MFDSEEREGDYWSTESRYSKKTLDVGQLPGYKWAMDKGLHLVNYNGNGNSATYGSSECPGLVTEIYRVQITVDQSNHEAEISFMFGLLTITTGRIGFPYRPFFENEIVKLYKQLNGM
jgi:hypothetical protein